MDTSVNLGAPDYQPSFTTSPRDAGPSIDPGMGDDPVIVANSLLATSSGVAPQPVGMSPAARAPISTPLGAPTVYIATPNSVFAPVVAPEAKGGGAQSSTPGNQPHSAFYLLTLDAKNNPVTEELPWGEDEVMVGSPVSPGNGGPGWNTAGDSVLGSAVQLLDNVVSGAVQGAATIADSHGYTGTTDAYPFSYGDTGYQSARNSFASSNTSGAGLLLLLLVLWVIFK